MSTTRTATDSAPDAVAAALTEAPFVRVLARADGDALAAAGLLARALRACDVPFQIHAAPNPTPDPTREALTVTTGVSTPAADYALARDVEPASVAAATVSRHLGVDPDPVLGLAGALAAGSVPGADGTDQLLAAAQDRALVDRRPGVAVPTAALADGIAHSTLLSAPFSGDPEAAHTALTPLDLPMDDDGSVRTDLAAEDHRRVASLVAVDVLSAEEAVSDAADAIDRAVHPLATPDGPFTTLGGYADVLGAVAREQPGTGVALALAHEQAAEAALDAWRRHATAVHASLQTATTGRYDGLLVARLDGDLDAGRLATAARLLLAFRSPEPVTLAVAGTTAAAVSDTDRELGRTMARAVERLVGDTGTTPADPTNPDGTTGVDATDTADATDANAPAAADSEPMGYGTRRRGEAQFDTDVQTFIAAFRKAL